MLKFSFSLLFWSDADGTCLANQQSARLALIVMKSPTASSPLFSSSFSHHFGRNEAFLNHEFVGELLSLVRAPFFRHHPDHHSPLFEGFVLFHMEYSQGDQIVDISLKYGSPPTCKLMSDSILTLLLEACLLIPQGQWPLQCRRFSLCRPETSLYRALLLPPFSPDPSRVGPCRPRTRSVAFRLSRFHLFH